MFQIYEQKDQNTKDFWDNMESLITYEFSILIKNLWTNYPDIKIQNNNYFVLQFKIVLSGPSLS